MARIAALLHVCVLCGVCGCGGMEAASAADKAFGANAEAEAASEASSIGAPQVRLERSEFLFTPRRGLDELPDAVETRLLNTGMTTLEILDTRESCGCGKPEFEAKSIPPGGATVVRYRLGTANFPRDADITSTILTDAPGAEELPIRVSVAWIEPVQLEPKTGILKFERVPMGQPAELKAAVVQNFGEPKLDTVRIDNGSDRFRVEVASPD